MQNQKPFKALTGLWLFLTVTALTASLSQSAITFTKPFTGITFRQPVYFGVFPGKPKTYVVLEYHAGNVILLSQNGTTWVKDTLLHIDVNSVEPEMGLLGIAFHPDFIHNRRYFISYDPPAPQNSVSCATGDWSNIVEERLADATLLKDSGAKGVKILDIPDSYHNHNGGTIAFGPDGYLYFGEGDGGCQGDPNGNAQNKDVLFGKILRIDVNKKETIKINGKDSLFNYGIPPTNPYAISGGRKEIFAYGLRNPWKWSFDPLNGDLWVGDVGGGAFEEVDIVTAGGNFGWKAMEGFSGTNNGSMILPIYSMSHPVNLAVIGGEVYRATNSIYNGTYFVADYYSKSLWSFKKNGTSPVTATDEGYLPSTPSSFGKDEFGRIYFVDLVGGNIYLLNSPDLGPGPVTIVSSPHFTTRPQHHIFHVKCGSNLNAEIFSGSQKVEVLSVKGELITSLRRESAQLPNLVKTGIYFLRSGANASEPDLLVVH